MLLSIPVEVAGGLRTESIILDVSKISERIVVGTLAFKDKPLLKSLLSDLRTKKKSLFLLIIRMEK